MIDILNINDINDLDIELVRSVLPTRFNYASNYKSKEDYLRSIGSSLLIIRNYPNIKDGDIYYDNNKPLIKDSYFNISHSNDIVVFTKSKNIVGIDIEFIKDRDLKIVTKVFQDSEINYINNNIENFYKLWCMKESVSKALGLGLDMDFKSFNVLKFLDNKPIEVLDKKIYNKTFLYKDKYYISVSQTECF